MSANAEFALVVHECESAIAGVDGLENRLRAAMQRAIKLDWCFDQDEQLRGAIGAVMKSYPDGSPEFERIEQEVKFLGRFGSALRAAHHGIPVNVFDALGELPEQHERIGIIPMWREVIRAQRLERETPTLDRKQQLSAITALRLIASKTLPATPTAHDEPFVPTAMDTAKDVLTELGIKW